MAYGDQLFITAILNFCVSKKFKAKKSLFQNNETTIVVYIRWPEKNASDFEFELLKFYRSDFKII